MQKYNLTRALISIQITNLINSTFGGIREKGIDSPEKVRGHKGMLVGFDEKMKEMHRDLKDYLYRNFYKHYKARLEKRARRYLES
jgi:hypothetical protein